MTSEFFCQTTSHKAYVQGVIVPKTEHHTEVLTTVSGLLVPDASDTTPLYLKITSANGTVLGTSKNTVVQSEKKGSYVTWYFDPITLPDGNITLNGINSEGTIVNLRLHTTNSNDGVTVINQYGTPNTAWTVGIAFNNRDIVCLDLFSKIQAIG